MRRSRESTTKYQRGFSLDWLPGGGLRLRMQFGSHAPNVFGGLAFGHVRSFDFLKMHYLVEQQRVLAERAMGVEGTRRGTRNFDDFFRSGHDVSSTSR